MKKKQKSHLSASTIPAEARLRRHWENISRPMYLRAILREQRRNRKSTRTQYVL